MGRPNQTYQECLDAHDFARVSALMACYGKLDPTTKEGRAALRLRQDSRRPPAVPFEEEPCQQPTFERYGVGELVESLFVSPVQFPWRSHLFPNCPSARKFYAAVLARDFVCLMRLSAAQFFDAMLSSLPASFPDLSFGYDASATRSGELGTVVVALDPAGTFSGAPLSLPGLPVLAPTGVRVALGPSRLKLAVVDLQVKAAGALMPAPDRPVDGLAPTACGGVEDEARGMSAPSLVLAFYLAAGGILPAS